MEKETAKESSSQKSVMMNCGNKLHFTGHVKYAASDEKTDDMLAQVPLGKSVQD